MKNFNLNDIENSNIKLHLQAAEKLGIKYELLDWNKLKIKFRKGQKVHYIAKKTLGINCTKAIETCRSKDNTNMVLNKAKLPVLKQLVVENTRQYTKNYSSISFPQVIKPLNGEKGKDIYLNIKNLDQGKKALKKVLSIYSKAIVEPYFKGKDYRFLVLNGKVIGISLRKPPQIIGDGKNNIKKLIDMENQRRHEYNQKKGIRMLNRIRTWSRIKWYLNDQGLKYSSVPKNDEKIILYPIPNFSTGGKVKTINTSQIHPSYLKIVLKAIKVIGLTIAGIDMLIKNPKTPATMRNCCIIEVNSDPGLRLHDLPNLGKPQGVTEKILKFIFS